MKGKTIGVVVSEWNSEITEALLAGAMDCFKEHGVSQKQLVIKYVPGSFELPLGAQQLSRKSKIDAVLALGCVIQGETRHFDFICNAMSNGLMRVGLKFNKPVIFGVLTTNNKQQALDRAGGKFGNKGEEAAITSIKMLGMLEN